MTYEVIILGHLHMPLYFIGTFTEYPLLQQPLLIDYQLKLITLPTWLSFLPVTCFMPIYGVFFHLCIKNFAEVNRNTENFSNFVLGSHSDYQFFRHLYFIELTLNYLLYI